MRCTVWLSLGLMAAAGCKDEEGRRGLSFEPQSIREPRPVQQLPSARLSPQQKRSDRDRTAARPEVDIEPSITSLDTVRWMDAPPALPRGAKVAVLEGAPPFPADRTFTLLAKLPPRYTIPPHIHLVRERITVLSGELSFGHGTTIDRKGATKVRAGGYISVPADHTHFAFTTDKETTIALTGVGPWEIIYVDPKDDPRPTPATRPANLVASIWDPPGDAKIVQARDVEFFEPPPGMLPPGAQMALLEGDPNVPKVFTMRLQLRAGVDIPVHSHTHTERVITIAGALQFAMGSTWAEGDLQRVKTPSVMLLPGGNMHYARALEPDTVIQITAVGPFDMKLASAEGSGAPTP